MWERKTKTTDHVTRAEDGRDRDRPQRGMGEISPNTDSASFFQSARARVGNLRNLEARGHLASSPIRLDRHFR